MASVQPGRHLRTGRTGLLKLVPLFVGIAMIAAACGGGDGGGGAEAPKEQGGVTKVKLLLPFSRSIAFWPVHVAEEAGFFKQQGLDIKSEGTDGSSFVVQQVAAGNAEFGIAVAEPVLLGFEQNQNFKSVYDFLTGNAFNLWVVDSSPAQKVGDLKRGGKIAIKDQAGGEIPRLNVQLERAGLKPQADIEYVQFGENTALAADMLSNGKVDALEISWNSLVGVEQALQKMGKKLRCITCSDQEALASESLIVSNKVFEDRRELVEKVGRALSQATLFGQTNPDAAIAIMKRVNPEEQVDEAYAKAYFTAALDIMKPRPAQNQYGWQDPATWQRSMELLLTPGIPAGLPQKVEINQVINNDLVAAYNQFDREAVIQQAKQAKS